MTTHLISIGGWDAPHIDTALNGSEWFAAWRRWNVDQVAHIELGFDGFDVRASRMPVLTSL